MAVENKIKEAICGLGLAVALGASFYFIHAAVRDMNSTDCCEENSCWFYEPVCVTYTAKNDAEGRPQCISPDHDSVEHLDGKVECCYCTTKDSTSDGFMTQFP